MVVCIELDAQFMGWKPMTRSSLAGLVEDADIGFDWQAVIDRGHLIEIPWNRATPVSWASSP